MILTELEARAPKLETHVFCLLVGLYIDDRGPFVRPEKVDKC